MKRSEWVEIAVWMRGYWPHAPLPAEAVTVQFEIVKDVEAASARAVIEVVAREGREHPPTAGMILQRVMETANPTPEWDQVQAEVERQVVSPPEPVEPVECDRGCDGGIVYDEAENTTHDCECRPERLRRRQQTARRRWSHELVAEWMTPERWTRWRDAINAGVGIATFRAQERDSFHAARRRWLEDRTLALAGVERAQLVAPEPRRRALPRSGATDLHALDTTIVQPASS